MWCAPPISRPGPSTWSPASKLRIDAPGKLVVKKIEAVEGITWTLTCPAVRLCPQPVRGEPQTLTPDPKPLSYGSAGCGANRSFRAPQGARLEHGQGPCCRLRTRLREPRRARPQGGSGPLAAIPRDRLAPLMG